MISCSASSKNCLEVLIFSLTYLYSLEKVFCTTYFSSWALSPMHITIFIRWLSILLFLFIGKLDFLVSKGLLFLYDKQNHVLESNQSVIQRTSNVSSLILMKIPSITKANSSVYYMYTENIIGSDILTVRVYVEGKFILFNCTHWCWIPAWGFSRKQGNAF